MTTEREPGDDELWTIYNEAKEFRGDQTVFAGVATHNTEPLTREQAERQAEEILKPKTFRVKERRHDLGGMIVESSAVDYCDAAHAFATALQAQTSRAMK